MSTVVTCDEILTYLCECYRDRDSYRERDRDRDRDRYDYKRDRSPGSGFSRLDSLSWDKAVFSIWFSSAFCKEFCCILLLLAKMKFEICRFVVSNNGSSSLLSWLLTTSLWKKLSQNLSPRKSFLWINSSQSYSVTLIEFPLVIQWILFSAEQKTVVS